MTIDPRSIFDAAIALPEAERVVLVERLLETLSAEANELSDDELLAELHRRRADVEAGTAQGVPWSDLKRQT
jgi:putative addiction module component (TIGR02574 family)